MAGADGTFAVDGATENVASQVSPPAVPSLLAAAECFVKLSTAGGLELDLTGEVDKPTQR